MVIRGVARIWEGGGNNSFFRFGMLNVAKRHAAHGEAMRALLGEFGGMLPRENFLKLCNLVRFGVYFNPILSSKFIKNYHFLYKRNNILDTRLL